MRRRNGFGIGAVLLGLVFAGTAWGVDEPVSSWIRDQTYPAIDGRNVVWEDFYSGSNYDIYRYDLSESHEYMVKGGDSNQRFPDISGSMVVWQDDVNGNWDIYACDITTGTVIPICTAPGDQERPVISRNLVVWQDSRNGNWDIYGYDLETETEFAICTNGFTQIFPDVSVTGSYDPIVVWQDNRNGNYDIYSYNVETAAEGIIVSHAGQQQYPAIDMPRVVWTDDRNGNNDIYMYTFNSPPPSTQVIENNPADQRHPAISGNVIVWQDFRNGSGDIYGGRLGTWNAFCICADSAVQAYPAVSGNYVVWHDARNSAAKDYDVYGGAIGADSWQACGTTLDFEYVLEYDSPDWTPITNHFAGVTFQAARPECSSDKVIIDNLASVGTASGVCAIGNYGCEFIPGHLAMIFDDPQQFVSFYVGSHCGTYTIQAFDATSGGNAVYWETFTLSCDLTEHGVFRFVEVALDVPAVRRIEVDTDGGMHIRIDDLMFNQDRTPPVARLDNPGFHECTCEIFPITGEVCDAETSAVSYRLRYQPVGADPDDWTEIGAFERQVCGSDVLAEWDTSGLDHGYYYLVLEAENGCGLTARDTTVAWVDKQYNSAEIRYPVDYDGSNGIVRGPSVCIDGTVWDNLCYDSVNGYAIDYRPVGGTWSPVLPGPDGTASVINDRYGTWDTTALPDGDYELRVTAADRCGNTKTDIVRPRIDNTPPIAHISSPANCTFLPLGSGLVPITGSAADANIQGWTLSYTGGTANDWVTLNSGTGNILNGLLAAWNPGTMEPCTYTLRLQVSDKARLNCSGDHPNYKEYTVTVKVGADLNGDGCVNLLDLALLSGEWLETCP